MSHSNCMGSFYGRMKDALFQKDERTAVGPLGAHQSSQGHSC